MEKSAGSDKDKAEEQKMVISDTTLGTVRSEV